VRQELRVRAFRIAAGSALALLIGTAAGCSPPAPLPLNASGTWSARTLDHKYVTVSVPSNWNVGEAWIQPSSFTDLVGTYSNQSLSDPCTTGANSITCGPPLQSLQPGTVLVEVFQNGSPAWTLDSEPGTPTTVSGQPARMTELTGARGQCTGLGADRSRSEFIPFPTNSNNWVEIDICSRGVADSVGARIMASVSVALPAT
jgi:hypothetical protein